MLSTQKYLTPHRDVWCDAQHLKLALYCVRKVEPDNYQKMLTELRRSKKQRKKFLTYAREMWQFKLYCIHAGIRP
jgi:hypothetical protein